MRLLDKIERRIIFERLVIGLEEPVHIKGVGEILAKIDSGNGGYNVLHGTDLYQEGDVLHFTTTDDDGNVRHVAKKIVDRIKVNIGGGNIQDRPVIKLDIKFANTLYKSIPFSITDRSDNATKILISKQFVQDELDALIDVGKKNISKDNIQVNESLGEVKSDKTSIETAIRHLKDHNYGTGTSAKKERREDILSIMTAIKGLPDADAEEMTDKLEQVTQRGKQSSSSSSTGDKSSRVEVGDKDSAKQAVDDAAGVSQDALIVTGLRLMALYITFKENCEREASEEDKKWDKIHGRDIKKAFQNADFALQRRAKKSDKKSEVQTEEKEEEEVLTEGVRNFTRKALNTDLAPNWVKSSSNVREGNQDPKHEMLMDFLKKNLDSFRRYVEARENGEKLIKIAYHNSKQPDTSSNDALRKEMESLLNTNKQLETQIKALKGKAKQAIDKDVSEGFWASFNKKLRDIDTAAKQIYAGNYSGSLIGDTIGFIKKWMSGGGVLAKVLKGTALAACVVNPFLALPVFLAYGVQQAIAMKRANKSSMSPQQIEKFSKEITAVSKDTAKTVTEINNTVASQKSLLKDDQEVIKEYIKKNGGADYDVKEGEEVQDAVPIIDFVTLRGGQPGEENAMDADFYGNLRAVADSSRNARNVGGSEGEEQPMETINSSLFIGHDGIILNEAAIIRALLTEEDEQADEKPNQEGEDGDNSLTDESSEEVISQAKDYYQELQNFQNEEVKKRKRFILYYVPLTGNNADVVKKTLQTGSLDEPLRTFCSDGKSEFQRKAFDTLVKEMSEKFSGIKAEGTGAFFWVHDEDEESESRTVEDFKEGDNVIIVHFGQGEKISKEEIEKIVSEIPSKEEFEKEFEIESKNSAQDLAEEILKDPNFKDFSDFLLEINQPVQLKTKNGVKDIRLSDMKPFKEFNHYVSNFNPN